MKNQTRVFFNQSLGAIAQLNGVENASEKFNVTPAQSQKIEEKIQQSSDFLMKINIQPVDNQIGEAIGLGVSSTIAGRTDTKGDGERKPVDPTGMDSNPYQCQQTNFDVAIRYEKLDAWSAVNSHTEFHKKFNSVVFKAIALDRIKIGFNGIKAAKTTDRVTNPLLQDVNFGWLQKIRDRSPERHMDAGATAGKVVIGETGDYKNLDALVLDLVDNFIDEVHQDSTDLVVICGRKLLADKNFPIVNQSNVNTEIVAGQVLVSQKQIGNLPAVRVPFFPAGALLITSFDNLSIYIQNESKRRNITDNSKKDQIEDYQSVNEDYVIEDYSKVAFAENIEIDGAK